MPTRAVEKASNRAERQLVEGMIAGTYPSGSALPGERDLCKQLGVARPALREALQRLARDGWLDIQQGKPTQVNGFMRDGNLNVLINLLQVDITLLPDFVPNLLEIWSLLAPGYAAEAIARQPQEVARLLYGFRGLADRPSPFARAQWRLHRALIDLCGNPVYGLIRTASTISTPGSPAIISTSRRCAKRCAPSGTRCITRRWPVSLTGART